LIARLPRAVDGRSAVQVARRCAREAGALARAAFGLAQTIGIKGRGDILTETDLAVERLIHQQIEAAFPDHSILSEETRTDTDTGGWTWVVDPIDGTKNFSIGVPFFCISIALCLDGVPQLGLIYDLVRREEFLAVAGRGLRVNRRPAYASTKASVFESVVGVDAGNDDTRGARAYETMRALWPNLQGIRQPASAALGLAYAACGRIDLFIHHNVYPWDVAAGLLLVEEAGGVATERSGRTATIFSRDLVVGGAAVHADFLKLALGKSWYEVD
jgi:fructose-1,6-bisphosphatase/inositol monophosphatase family enzyme